MNFIIYLNDMLYFKKGKIVSQFDEDGDGDIGNLERKRAINGFIYAINSPKPKKGPHGTKVKGMFISTQLFTQPICNFLLERSKPMHTLEDEVFAATKKVNRDRSKFTQPICSITQQIDAITQLFRYFNGRRPIQENY